MINPEMAGTEIGSVRFPIDRSKLAELARAFGDDDAVWHDADAARAAGFADIPMHPTTTVIADHWRKGGATAMVDALGADLARVLHGEASWEFLAPVRVGTELTATQRIVDVTTREGRRGGTMTLVPVVTEYADAAGGELLVRRRDTVIELGA